MWHAGKISCVVLVILCCQIYHDNSYSQGVVSGSTYKIVARHSGKVLESQGGSTTNATNIQQATWAEKAWQQWTLTDVGDGYWRISPRHRPRSAFRRSNNNLEQRSYADEPTRQWKLIEKGDGYYQIFPKDFDGGIITIENGSTAEGANAAVLAPVPDVDYQDFKLEPVSVESALNAEPNARNEVNPQYTDKAEAQPTPIADVPIVSAASVTKGMRPRVIATTDGEVDDRSSMIRFLLYACDFDIVGIVQVNSKYQKRGHSDKRWIEHQLEAYEEVLPNLRKHNPNYPDADTLRSVMRVGNENIEDLWTDPPNMQTQDTDGAQLIIDRLLDDDPRPVHVLSWGGTNTTASALWKLKSEYSKERFDYAVSRIRIYCIWYQDGGGKWIQENIPEAYINEAYRWDNVWDYESYDHARSHGKMSSNPPFVQEYMKPEWLNENVKNGHGPLGALTPQKYISEGDTPSFLHLVNNGLEAHLDYTRGGWGGRSAYDDPAFPNHVTDKVINDDGNRNKMYWRWIPAAQNDFAARLDRCIASDFADANHPPVAKVNGELTREIKVGETVKLSATATDPDGDSLVYNWWQYADADSAESKVKIEDNNSLQNASFTAPDEPGKQVHIVLEVSDNGVPPLVGYQRVICNIK